MGVMTMKTNRAAAIICAAVLGMGMLTGCGDSSSMVTESKKPQQTASSAAETAKTVKDTDVFEGLLKNGGEKWLGLTREQISQRSGGAFDKANAKESTEDYDVFDLGEQTAILGGKADIGVKMPVSLWISYKDGKATKLMYDINHDETVYDADEKPVLAALEKFLTENVAQGYTKKEGNKAMGKGSFYFFNGDKQGYVFEVHVSSGVGSTNFPVKLSVQTYADKYGK